MKKKIFKNRYIYIFIFFLVLLILSPISGDDWGNYLVGKEGVYKWFSIALGMYFDWEGRLVSRICINILTYNKWLFNICNSFLITSIIYLINKCIKSKNKNIIFCLSIMSILCMNIYTFSQVFGWVAGNITYLFPAMMFMYVLW